jgi:hypothetical protein
MGTTPDNQPPTLNTQNTTSTLSALVDGLNVETASSIFIDFYRLHPEQAVAALLILLSGDHDNRVVFGSLLKGLFDADRLIAWRVFLGLLGLGSGEA